MFDTYAFQFSTKISEMWSQNQKKKQVASNHVDRSQWFVSKAGDLDEWNPGETWIFSGGRCGDRPTIRPLFLIGGMFGGVGWQAMKFQEDLF